MDPNPQAVPGYYVWSPPGTPVIVHMSLDVIDRLSAEVMRGFGAVPKRGAEIGGVLVGAVEPGTPTIVRIEDFDTVPCGYKRGPSYLLTEEEAPLYEDAVGRWPRDGSRPIYAVGYFRSDTREGLRLAPEDTELLEACFPSAAAVALLIKPYATKVSVAGFFVREFGTFPPETKIEFPFRRRELTGEEPPPRRSLYERRQRSARGGSAAVTAMTTAQEQPSLFAEPEPVEAAEPTYATTASSKARKRTWVWIPLSFIFLLVGVVLGFQAALTFYPQLNATRSTDLTLNLAADRNGDSVTVHWNRDAAPIRNAQKGELHIVDGGKATTSVSLGRADLQTGSVVYQNASASVQFRLVIFLSDKLTVSEALDWRQ